MSVGRLLRALALWLGLAAGVQAGGSETLFAATLSTPDGRPLALADYRGKPLLVNFWARWCAPCRSEIPELLALRRAQAGRGLQVIGIGVEDDAAAVGDFLKAYAVDYPVGIGRDKAIWLLQTLGNSRAALPFTLAIDRRGEIVLGKLGPFTQADFAQIAERLLQ